MTGRSDSADKNFLDRAAAALQCVRDVHDAIHAGQLALLLEVAREPGHGPSEYGRRLGDSQAVVSRNLQLLGARTRSGKPGLGLVEGERDAIDLRQWRFRLTPKGQKLVNEMLVQLRGGIL